MGCARRQSPEAGRVLLSYYATVEDVFEIADVSQLPRLQGLHGWSDRVVSERFHCKRDGLFALVRVWELPSPFELPESPHFAGCRSLGGLAGHRDVDSTACVDG
ncbi:MAG: DUF1802 family protein [Planctomycetaceae bacterium]